MNFPLRQSVGVLIGSAIKGSFCWPPNFLLHHPDRDRSTGLPRPVGHTCGERKCIVLRGAMEACVIEQAIELEFQSCLRVYLKQRCHILFRHSPS